MTLGVITLATQVMNTIPLSEVVSQGWCMTYIDPIISLWGGMMWLYGLKECSVFVEIKYSLEAVLALHYWFHHVERIYIKKKKMAT